MILSRRQFHQLAGAAVAASAFARKSYGFAENGPQLGLNTFSLRALSQDEAIPVIVQVMKQAKLRDCELLFSHVEPAKLSPVFGVGALNMPRTPPTPEELEKRKATAAALTEWRMSVPMSYFENIRASFEKEGLKIKAFNARLGSTEEEVDRQFLMAKALGADGMIVRIAEPATSMVAAAAEKHKMKVGLQISDAAVVRRQLAATKYFSMDPDIGDLTKGNKDALQFVKDNLESITSLDLKDTKPGGPSVPFGEGDSHILEVLRFLKEKQAQVTTYIDIDYAGTGRSTDEVMKCVTYARQGLA